MEAGLCFKKIIWTVCVLVGWYRRKAFFYESFIPSVNTDDQKGRLLLMLMQTRKSCYFQSVEQYKNASQALCSDASFISRSLIRN